MSFIADGAALAGKLLMVGLVIFVAFLIILAVIDWFVKSQEALQQNADNIKDTLPVIADSITKLCGLEDHVTNTLNQSLVDSLTDPNAQEFANRLLDGQKLTDCEWHEFINHLNEWEKRKLRVYDFICDLSNCIQ